jgi:hypothetical protein
LYSFEIAHAGVSELFVGPPHKRELAILKNALDKVTVDCTFG